MEKNLPDIDRLYWRWVRASLLGWLIGLVLLLAVATLLDMMMGELEFELQFMVGASIGLGVGFMQGRTLRAWLERPNRWMLSSAVGMGALFFVSDILGVVGVNRPYSLPIYIVLGAAVTGLWQWRLLRAVSERAGRWVVASLLGWGIPAAFIAFNDSGAGGASGTVASVIAIFLGGAIVGAVSGKTLVSILRQSD